MTRMAILFKRLRPTAWFFLALGMLWPATVTVSASENTTTVERLIVDKSDRRLDFIADDKVIRSFRISLGSRPTGDKNRQGDQKTPEGCYIIDWRNSERRFYRSLHISYPNAADREEACRSGVDPGSMIMTRGLPNEAQGDQEGYLGMDWTDGCIALSHEEIDQLWASVKDGTPIDIVP
jgi:murein L,D-transpeptidase YafK